jgi:hypothetical protein
MDDTRVTYGKGKKLLSVEEGGPSKAVGNSTSYHRPWRVASIIVRKQKENNDKENNMGRKYSLKRKLKNKINR